MRIQVQRYVDRFAGQFLCRILSLVSQKDPGKPIPEKEPRILTIILSEMGSLVLAYPMFQYLKATYPGVSLHVLLMEKNREVLEVLDVIPRTNIHTVNDVSFLKFAMETARVLRSLRKIGFHAVIDCELFARISSIIALLSGAPVRAGFHPYTQEGLYRGSYINRPVLYNPYHHISEQFVTLAEALHLETFPRAKRVIPLGKREMPSVGISETEISSMRMRLNEDFKGILLKRLVLIYPGGGLLPVRAWPIENYGTLAKELIDRGYAVGVIGLPSDRDLAGVLQRHCQNEACYDFTGYTRSIRELLILFHIGSLLLTNDGGPVHFASLTPIPVIAFFGPETPLLYGNLSSKALNLSVPLSCSPCLTAYNHRNSPCDGDNLCLKLISPEEVLAKALAMLEGL